MKLLRRLRLALLTDDIPQRIRLAQSGLAILLMWVCVGVMHFGVAHGAIDGSWIWHWTAVSVGGMAVIFGVIRSGLVRHWADPSLAQVQMFFAIGCGAVAYLMARELRSAVLPIIAVILMFGMFGMSVRQVLAVAAYTMALFGAAAWWLARGAADAAVSLHEQVDLAALGVVSLAACALTARINTMRRRGRRQKAALEAALAENRRLATQDALTGCLNRRAMGERLAQAAALAARYGTVCSVVMVDLDHFKQVNDQHGHAMGDEVLRTVAGVLGAGLRDADALARWGGEEFLLLLPGTPLAAAVQCAQRLQAALGSQRLPMLGEGVRLTFSAGVAEYTPGQATTAWLERADDALYRAKQAGRARVLPARAPAMAPSPKESSP